MKPLTKKEFHIKSLDLALGIDSWNQSVLTDTIRYIETLL